MDPISQAVGCCPFLHGLAREHGESFARSIAINPTCPAGQRPAAPLVEEMRDYKQTLLSFHGPDGVRPLPTLFHRGARPAAPGEAVEGPASMSPARPVAGGRCPFAAQAQFAAAQVLPQASPVPQAHQPILVPEQGQQLTSPSGALVPHRHPLEAAPLASMSMSFGGSGGWVSRHRLVLLGRTRYRHEGMTACVTAP